MKTRILVAVLIAMTIGISTVSAQTTQRGRIRQGVQSGELTKTEAHNLRAKERNIRQEKVQAKSDGIVTKEERKNIRKDKRQASNAIYRKKHNRRDRG